ncbi:hypothetical protein D3C72_1581260 [compost metagenome]
MAEGERHTIEPSIASNLGRGFHGRQICGAARQRQFGLRGGCAGHRRRSRRDLGRGLRRAGRRKRHPGRQGLLRVFGRDGCSRHRGLVCGSRSRQARGRDGQPLRHGRPAGGSRLDEPRAGPDVGRHPHAGRLGLPVSGRRRRRVAAQFAARSGIHAPDAQAGQAGRRQDPGPSSRAGTAARRARRGRRRGRRGQAAGRRLVGARGGGRHRHGRLRIPQPRPGLQCADGRRPADGGGARRGAVRHGVLQCVRHLA